MFKYLIRQEQEIKVGKKKKQTEATTTKTAYLSPKISIF